MRRSIIALVALLLAACSSAGPKASAPVPSPSGHTTSAPESGGHAVKPQKPVPAESNPPGDIPDNTAFVPYRSHAGHFVVKVPEGWSRRNTKSGFSFTDKLNSVSASWFHASRVPTKASAASTDVHNLRRTVRAFRLGHVIACAPSCTIPYSTAPISVTLPESAVVITYESNSAPNQVTGKQYRDEDLRFEFFKNGQEVALTLSGPVGSDNVDPWTLVSQSFRWTK